jgi:competence protein ComEA
MVTPLFIRSGDMQPAEKVIGIVLITVFALSGYALWYWERQREPVVIETIPAPGAVAVDDPGQVLVDVGGAVKNPGVFELPAGARVEDALAAAGGPSDTADLNLLTLSRASLVTDGQKITVPQPGVAPVVESASPADAGCVRINAASAAALDTLPGIGEVRAQRIIEGRPFATPQALVETKILPASVFADIADLICL